MTDLFATTRTYAVATLDRVANFVPDSIVKWTSGSLPFDVSARSIALAATLLAVLVLLVLLARLRRGKRREQTRKLSDLTRSPRRLGYLIIGVLVFGLGTWSAYAPLEGAAIAPGVISPEGHRRTVQHLEGGIVRAIHVQEGDTVSEGQILLTLDDVEARARLEELENRYVHLQARSARLEAELRGSDTLVVPDLEIGVDASEFEKALNNQRELLLRRITTRVGRDDVLGKRVSQLREENIGLQGTVAGLEEKARLVEEETALVTDLVEKGFERKTRLWALRRAAADITIDHATSRAQISRNDQKIGETELQLLTMSQQHVEDATEELTEVRRALAEITSELRWRADVVSRTDVRSPISGTVINLRMTTLSGVVRGGEPILEIVPSEVPLIIDARVKPNDIDLVSIHMPARIILSVYQQRNMPQIIGSLRSVSADSLIDERTGEVYFQAKVEVPRSEIENLRDIELVSGMPVEVMLLTGKATVADYVIGPLVGSLRRSFRENNGS